MQSIQEFLNSLIASIDTNSSFDSPSQEHQTSAQNTAQGSDRNNDWPCTYCTLLNSSNVTICDACGRYKIAVSSDGPSRTSVESSWICQHCNCSNDAATNACARCFLLRGDNVSSSLSGCAQCGRPCAKQKCLDCSSTTANEYWSCVSCSAKNSTRAQLCAICNSPKPIKVEQGEEPWACSYCSFINMKGKANICLACNLPRMPSDNLLGISEKPKEQSILAMSKDAHSSSTITTCWICSACQCANSSMDGTKCRRCNRYRCFACRNAVLDGDEYLHIQPKKVVGDKSKIKTLHLRCFKCAGCGERIVSGQFIQGKEEEDLFHPDCHEAIFGLFCRLCERAIQAGETYYQDPAWSNDILCHTDGSDTEKVAKHRCIGCDRIWPESKLNEMLHLSDAVQVCPLCAHDCILDGQTEQVLSIQARILKFFSLLGLNIPQQSIPVHVVDASRMHSSNSHVGVGGASHTLGRCETHFEHLSLGGRRISTTARVQNIRIIAGLPQEVFEDVLCHETMHAYISLNGFPQLDSKVEEGLCQLLSFLWLKRDETYDPAYISINGNHRQRVREIRLEKLDKGTDPIYGEGFRLCYLAFLQMGCLAPLLDYVRRYGKLPQTSA